MSCPVSHGKCYTEYCSNPKYLKLFRLKVSCGSGLICLKHEKHNTEVSWHYPHFHKPLQLLTDILQVKQERSQIHTGISTVRQKRVWSVPKPAVPSSACHCAPEKQVHMYVSFSSSPSALHTEKAWCSVSSQMLVYTQQWAFTVSEWCPLGQAVWWKPSGENSPSKQSPCV